MPETSLKQTDVQALTRGVLAAALLCALPAWASAESLSSRVHACAAESDSLRRLMCYDKNVAPFAETPAAESRQPAVATSESQNLKADPAPVAAKPARAVDDNPRHTSARVVSIDSEHGEMVLHLDNGQVWEQAQEPTADMNLHVGDTVTIDRRSLMGSYWLGGRTEGVMKVKRRE